VLLTKLDTRQILIAVSAARVVCAGYSDGMQVAKMGSSVSSSVRALAQHQGMLCLCDSFF